jgi:hypothetical protein
VVILDAGKMENLDLALKKFDPEEFPTRQLETGKT